MTFFEVFYDLFYLKRYILICMFFYTYANLCKIYAQFNKPLNEKDTLSVIFYNVENLFDNYDDPGQGDDEYTQNGLRRWSYEKFNTKIYKISQVLLSANDWKLPDLIGVSEIENRNVLNKLCSGTIMKEGHFNVLHKESPDHRGIDVGLLYNTNKLQIIDSGFYEVQIDTDVYSRDILYASFLCKTDTLHIFVCHWPSRFGGILNSKEKRMLASNILFKKYKEIINKNSNSKILIMGDFNDEPHDNSLKNLIEKAYVENQYLLNNLMEKKTKLGTLKYRNQWYVFDQFIVSSSLLISEIGYEVINHEKICFIPFVLVKDKKYLGVKPYRTFEGYKYIGGYSDHLPIRLRLYLN